MIGKVLKGKYRVLEKVGTGGFATVYLGRNLESNEVVAIKILKEEHTEESKFVERFRREAKMARRMQHPNVVRMIDYGIEDNVHYLIMEYVQGRTLAEIIHQKGQLPVATAVTIAAQVAQALEVAEQAGVVHRDIKPHNVMVTPDGTVKVMDFGIARMSSMTSLTQTGMFMGTPRYLSPEMARGEKIDIRSDIYALGIVLFEMLIGNTPFVADSPWAIMRHQIETVPPAICSLRQDVPEWLEAVVAKALAKDPQDRFQRPADIVASLTGHEIAVISQSIGDLARTPPPRAQAPTLPKRRIHPAFVGGFVAIIILIAVLVPTLLGGNTSTPTPTLTSDADVNASAKIATATVTRQFAETFTPPVPTTLPTTPTATDTSLPTSSPTPIVIVVTSTSSPSPSPSPTYSPSPSPSPSTTPSPSPKKPSRTPKPTAASVSPSATHEATSPPGTGVASTSGRIAFATIQSGTYVLYSANPDGTGLRWLGDDLRQPSYRQDGELIVANGHSTGHDDLWKVKPDGSGTIGYFGHPEDSHPVWLQSTTGYHVGCGSTRHGDGQWRLYMGDGAVSYGSGQVRGRYPVWLPAESMAYQGCDYGFGTSSRCGLYRVSIWGGTPSLLTDDPNDIPTGAGDAGVLFARQADGNWDVYLVSPTGGPVRRLTDHASNDGLATFSPEGKTIAFVSDRTGKWAVWLMGRDGSNQRKAFDLPGSGYGADWMTERISWGRLPAAPTPVPTDPGAHLLPAPDIKFPIPRDTVASERETTVRWTWEGTLAANQGFQVRFWHASDPAPMGVAPPTTDYEIEVHFGMTDAYRVHGEATYYLDVVVVQIEPYKVLSRNKPIQVTTDPNKR